MARFQVKLKQKMIYPLGSPVEVIVKIKNRTRFPYYLLKSSLGMDELEGDSFQITYRGKEVEYDGFLVKKAEQEENPEDYILLNAGATLKISTCLAKKYILNKAGRYHVRYSSCLQFRRVAQSGMVLMPMYEKANSNKKSFRLIGSKKKMHTTVGQAERRKYEECMENMRLRDKPGENNAGPKISVSIDSKCSEEFEQNFIQATRKAHYILAYYLEHSRKELSIEDVDVKNKNLHYRMVFGDYDENRYQAVQQVYDKVSEAMKSDKLQYIYKNWAENVFGYTTKGSLIIYLCEAYMRAALTGEDSKVGTLLHELTHTAADTDDVKSDDGKGCYGRKRCRSMARFYPEKAIKNAENYEFFLESQFLNRMTERKWNGTEDAARLLCGGPAVICFGEFVYLFYVDKTNIVKYSVYHKDTEDYDEVKPVVDEQGEPFTAAGHPVAISNGDKLYLFFIEVTSGKLMMSLYSGESFTTPSMVITKNGSGIEPAYISKPVLYNEMIHFVYRKKDGLGIYRVFGDGVEWENEEEIGGTPLENYFLYNPAMCVHEEKLYLFYQIAQGEKEERCKIYYAYYDKENNTWRMNHSVDQEIVLPVEEGKTCYPTEAYSAICAESQEDMIYLVFRGEDSSRTIQLQMSENRFLNGQREWMDLEKLKNSSTEGLKLEQYMAYDITCDSFFYYMVYQNPKEDGIFISTKMK